MDTPTNSKSSLHPVLWIAALAIILFSAIGIGKQMGWFSPSSATAQPESVVSDAKTKADIAAKNTAQQKSAQASKPAVKHSKPASSSQEREVERSASNHYPPTTRTALPCTDCGIIQSVRVVETPVEASGVGAVAGGVVGGVLGHQVGKGKGKDVATVAGAVLGGIAGHQIEKKVRTEKHYEIDVTMVDGTTRTLRQDTQPTWQAGDHVTVRDGIINARSSNSGSNDTQAL